MGSLGCWKRRHSIPIKKPSRSVNPNRERWFLKASQSRQVLLLQLISKRANLGGDFIYVGFERKVSGVVKDHFRGRIVPAIGLGARRQEERIILSPDRQSRRLIFAEEFLEFRVELDVGFVVADEVVSVECTLSKLIGREFGSNL